MEFQINTANMKVFGIGLSRTGTTSLSKALAILGLSVQHFPTTLKAVSQFEGLLDTPIALGYQFLDVMFPNSKFILTDRAEADWLRSCECYWKRYLVNQTRFQQQLHIALYGCTSFSEDKFRSARWKHISTARDYFALRPDDFLELRICDGEGWSKLCRFLGKPTPLVEFPHANATNR